MIEFKSRYGSYHQPILNSLRPDFLKLSGKNFNISQMRTELNKYGNSLKGKQKSIIFDVIYILKQIHCDDHVAGQYRDHELITDHAFCRGLARIYGVDMFKVKERMIEAIKNSEFEYISNKNKIITVLPVKKKK